MAKHPKSQIQKAPGKRKWIPPEMHHGQFTKWNWIPYYPEKIKMGKFVDIGALTFLSARYGIVLQDHVQIGSHCALHTDNSIDGRHGQIVIMENARIGAHCTIMPGVTIGKNAVVGAHTTVTQDVPEGFLFTQYRAYQMQKMKKVRAPDDRWST